MLMSEAKESWAEPKQVEKTITTVESPDTLAVDLMSSLELLQKFLTFGEELIEINADFKIFDNAEKGKLLSLCGEAVAFLDQWDMADVEEDEDDE